MNAKDFMIHSAQQDSIWLRLAKGILFDRAKGAPKALKHIGDA